MTSLTTATKRCSRAQLGYPRGTVRRDARIPMRLEVAFRTRGAFLVAYSANLSKGGLFIETEEALPPGTPLTIRLVVPGYLLTIDGEVAWVRGKDEGQPGLGIRFVASSVEQLGPVIDSIVVGFKGLRVLVYAASGPSRAHLGRMVRSLLSSAIVIEASEPRDLDKALAQSPEIDLAVVELQRAGLAALRTIRLGRAPSGGRLPVLALASDDGQRAQAVELGAERVLPNPPALADLQQAVMDVLGKPSHIEP
jgi:uncharacterized protein (TIGR02266 family)